MLSSTKTAITAILRADPTIDAGMVAAAIEAAEQAISGKTVEAIQPPVTRHEVAKILGMTPQRVDQIARAGALVRVVPKGSKRAIGYTRDSVNTLVSGTRNH